MDSRIPVPAHIPDRVVRDFDFYNLPGTDGGVSAEIHVDWKRVQDTFPDVFWTPHHGGHWVLTRFAQIERLLLDHGTFSSRRVFLPEGIMPFLIPVQFDPPEHARYRRLMAPAFTPAALARATDRARRAAVECIEEIAQRGSCEFMEDFAGVMPVVAFLNLVNLPESDAPYLHGLARRTSTLRGDAPQAWVELADYVKGQIDERRKSPREDLISSLLTARVDDRPLTDDEIFSMCMLVVSGGLDTVAHMTTFAACFLAQHPDHRRGLIADPGLLDNAVEEVARRFGTSNLGRVAVHDTELGGERIKAGDMVVGIFPLAGLDERMHQDPLAVDWGRKLTRHLAFGAGVHTCIGIRLAKREIRIFLEEWLKRIADFHLAEGTQPRMRSGLINLINDVHLVVG
ncbi:MAG: cytochrome P450 [Gammaproteobacteria bacterium]